MTKEEIIPLIKTAALAHSLDPLLLQAIVSVESNYNANVMRYEPNWIYLYSPPVPASRLGITITTETQLQMFSWGLTQCMGSVLRELGFQDYLPCALDPAINLDYGARHLKSFVDKYSDNTAKAIASYNAGSPIKLYNGQFKNQEYVTKVTNVYNGLSSALGIIA